MAYSCFGDRMFSSVFRSALPLMDRKSHGDFKSVLAEILVRDLFWSGSNPKTDRETKSVISDSNGVCFPVCLG
ncbi:hypothetical protein OWV82_010259 [Melia azedarach]|uniref:Uncharacterized protein n=1 Tax=Melia azedarach TaxID=155640 RepID=A0ACC1Y4H1_MELAZ|nr:hypothetical protein OWV82_010259 [Melia azedarach]